MEACEWKWTLSEAMQQPAALLDAVVRLKSTGLKMRRQIEKEKEGKL